MQTIIKTGSRNYQPVEIVSWSGRRRLITLCLICALPLLLALAVFLFAQPSPDNLTLARADLRLATWLSVAWSMAPQDPASLRQLADELKALNVDDVFVYVSYFKPDGSFNQTYDYAPAFVAALKRNAPALRVLAWIGLPVSLEGAMPAERLHSSEIQAATLMPYPPVAHHWSATYLRRVAQQVDQIVLMAYDSGLVFPRDYLTWTRYQVARSQKALSDVAAELIIGASVSAEWTLSHQTQAETFAHFLAGLKAGVAERLDGIALYPFWELDQSESMLIAGSLGH